MLIDVALWQQAAPPQPRWLVPQLFTKGSLILIAGTEGVGKSVFGYTLSIALAAGVPFLGRQLEGGTVCYFDEENSQADMHAYFHRAWQGLDAPRFAFDRLRLHSRSLGTHHWAQSLYQELAAAHPHLVVIDTVNPACCVLDENDNAEAARACQAIRRAQDAASPDCTVILFKHLRQGGLVDLRGAKHWKGAVDTVLYHQRVPGHSSINGQYRTMLTPMKIRAYGLQNTLPILPKLDGPSLQLIDPASLSVREEAELTGLPKSTLQDRRSGQSAKSLTKSRI